MSIGGYIHAHRGNLKLDNNLQHLSILIPFVNKIYNDVCLPATTNLFPRYRRFLLLWYRSFLSAAILIGQAHPEDAAPMTRRAIEVAKICFGGKFKLENLDKWLSYQISMKRLEERQK